MPRAARRDCHVESFSLFIISWRNAGTKPLICKNDRNVLACSGGIFYRNDFLRFLCCRLLASEGGTSLVGRYRMRPLITVVMILWLLLAACLFIGLAWTDVAENQTTIQRLIPLGFRATVAAVLSVGRLLSHIGEKKMVALLKSTLEATECSNTEGV